MSFEGAFEDTNFWCVFECYWDFIPKFGAGLCNKGVSNFCFDKRDTEKVRCAGWIAVEGTIFNEEIGECGGKQRVGVFEHEESGCEGEDIR